MRELTPFEAAQERATITAENLARADDVNGLIEQLMEEERACSLPISGSNVEGYFQSEDAQGALAALNVIATIDYAMGISA